MKSYTREDGTLCEAVLFIGGGENAADHLFKVLGVLNEAELQAVWVGEETTDEWVENEEGDDYVQVVIPEHIKTINDELWIGDYVLRRDGDTYIMDGQIFEAIWTEVIERAALTAPATITRCRHCDRTITNLGSDGIVYKGYKHTEGVQRGLTRCWPGDTEKPYGLDAEPVIKEAESNGSN